MRALLIDDELHRANSIAGILPVGLTCVWAPNGPVGEEQLRREQWDMLLLDHDLYCASGKSGRDMALLAIETQNPCAVFIHSQNAHGAEEMRKILDCSGFFVTVSPWLNDRGTAAGLKEWMEREMQCLTHPQAT